MPSRLTFGAFALFSSFVLLGSACSTPAEDESAADATVWTGPGVVAASNETTAALGVAYWVTSEGDDGTISLVGYDATKAVRAQLDTVRIVDENGVASVQIKDAMHGPAEMVFRPGEAETAVITKNTFRDHADAQKTLERASADVKATAPSDGPLITNSLRPLETPLVGNQVQLICLDQRGRACTAPPSVGATTRDCVLAAIGVGGLGCLVTGPETVGVGCIITAGAAAYGVYQCVDAVGQRSTCSCQTPCEAQCARQYNRQYACSQQNPRPCSDAVAADRAAERACKSACPRQ
jgi:hypothetical protein